METARAIRPDEVSLKAYYGNMFYQVSETMAQCMYPGCFTKHAMPKGSFSSPMKHLKKYHDIVLAGNDLKVLIEAEAEATGGHGTRSGGTTERSRRGRR